MGTQAGNRIRFARGMLGSWQDILEPGRDAGPVLLTPLPHFYCRFARIPGPNFLLQKSEICFLAEMSHPRLVLGYEYCKPNHYCKAEIIGIFKHSWQNLARTTRLINKVV
jgi:hypothetical protein